MYHTQLPLKTNFLSTNSSNLHLSPIKTQYLPKPRRPLAQTTKNYLKKTQSSLAELTDLGSIDLTEGQMYKQRLKDLVEKRQKKIDYKLKFIQKVERDRKVGDTSLVQAAKLSKEDLTSSSSSDSSSSSSHSKREKRKEV